MKMCLHGNHYQNHIRKEQTMKKKKLIKSIAKYAIKHNCEVTLQAKDRKSKSKNFLIDSGSVDTGLELCITPKGADTEC